VWDPLTRTLLALTFVTGIVDAVCFLALGHVFAAMQTGNVIFLGLGVADSSGAPVLAPLIALGAFLAGGSAAALLIPAGPASGSELRTAMAVEVGLLGAAAVPAEFVDVDPGDLTAYALIAMLSLAMGLRNTTARRIGDPNLATTVLNLTLSAFVSHTPTGIASEGELALRGAAIAAILAGAVAGALLLKVSLALAIGVAAAVVLVARGRSSLRRLAPLGGAAIVAVLFVSLIATGISMAGSLSRPMPRILSASWGTDGAVGCPNGEQGLDNIPVTFNWFIRRDSIQPSDFRIVRSDRSVATPTCALQFPPNEFDEAQTVNLIGDFGDSASGGPTPAAIRVTGDLQGKAPGAHEWRPIQRLPKISVAPLSGGPYIVDAWTLMPSIYRGDPNRCMVGKTFVRVMWSNGLTAYPTGEAVGTPVAISYRALYKLATGRTLAIAPLEVADLHDHETSFNADNMHDLCLPRLPRGARLTGVTIAANLIQDPDGDPNPVQKFKIVAPGQPTEQKDGRISLRLTAGGR